MAFYQYTSSKPMPAFNFLVFVGPLPLSFSKVSSIEIAIETQALAEGGENRYVHSLSAPISSEKVIVLEKGVPAGVIDSAVGLLADTVLRVGATFEVIIVTVLDQNGMPKKLFAINGAILRKRSFSELNAISGSVLIETLEFVYEDLTEVPGVSLLFAGIGALNSVGAIDKILADEKIRLAQTRNPSVVRSSYTLPKSDPPWPSPPKKYEPYKKKQAE